MADTRPPKLVTPLTIGAAIVVAAFGIANIVIEPERALIWLLGILFLPLMISLLAAAVRREGRVARAIGKGGGVRAGLVAAGAALATAFAFAFTDEMGWTGEEGQLSTDPVWIVLLPLIAIGIELVSTRLETRAEKDPGRPDDG